MAIATAAIRTAVSELLEGDIGDLDAGTFAEGAFDGQPDAAKLAVLRQTSTASHWFDVVIDDHETHESSSLSNRATTRRVTVPIAIEVWTGLATEAQEDDRAELLASITDDLETACQALSEPSALDETSAAVATGIVGGLMRDRDHGGQPSFQIVEERWDKRWVHSRIEGAVIVGAT